MIKNDFATARDLLLRVRAAMGGSGLVGLALDGDLLVVSHVKPETEKKMMQMRFDGPDDYELSEADLLTVFAEMSAKHFAPQSEDLA